MMEISFNEIVFQTRTSVRWFDSNTFDEIV